MSELKATPGPWRWEMNLQSKQVSLVGGKPQFDKTVMDFERWGMGSAAPRFNEQIAGNQYNIMTRVHENREWIKPFEGRSHHANWCAAIDHPDAHLIAASPDLYASLKEAAECISDLSQGKGGWDYEGVLCGIEALLEKARGES